MLKLLVAVHKNNKNNKNSEEPSTHSAGVNPRLKV